MNHDEQPARGMSLHTKVLLGLILGAACGIAANQLAPKAPPRTEAVGALAVVPAGGLPGAVPWAALALSAQKAPKTILEVVIENVFEPIGQVFLRLLTMTVVPLVLASLAVGVARLGDLRSLGRIGAKTFAFFIVTMTMAVTIGLFLVNVVEPGGENIIDKKTRDQLVERYGGEAKKRAEKPAEFGVETFVNIVPRNPFDAMVRMDMLQVIFFALLIGIGLTVIEPQRSKAFLTILEALGDLMVVIINLAMRLAPYAVFALVFSVTARFGFELLQSLGAYVLVVVVGLALQMFGTLSLLVWLLARLNPLVFFKRVRNIMVTAFSTSSSNATLPTSIKLSEEELKVPPQIAGFVLPLGATMNMNGTALFEGVTVVFLAQVFGKDLTLGQQIVIVVLSVLTAIGAAGVPGGSLPLLVMILEYAGVPPLGLALVLGVDRLLDMCRTTLNVIGDVAAAAFVTHSEGYPLATD
jgi:DAACS family dicarboxylate/amino acid:cation (Na+ or H+) symporter